MAGSSLCDRCPAKWHQPCPNPDCQRHIPAEYTGEKLPPNYYCRGGNEKRQHWCRRRAGTGTDHTGLGRCKTHDGGGDLRTTHGARRRYGVQGSRLSELIEELEADDLDPLNMLPELNAQRGMIRLVMEEIQNGKGDLELIKAAGGLVDGLSKCIKRVQDARASKVVSILEFQRALRQVAVIVERHNDEPDPEKRIQKIKNDWLSLRLG